MSDFLFIILIIILIIAIALVYRCYQQGQTLLKISQGYLNKIISKGRYVILDMDQMMTLPDKYKEQAEYLISEIREQPTTLADIKSETPFAHYLILFDSNKTLVALLKVYDLKRYPWVYQHIAGIAKSLNKSDDNPIFISGVIVHPKYRGEGYGRSMFEILKKYIKQDMVLEVKKDNTAAIALYKGAGFKLLGHSDDTYVMRYYLKG